MTSSRKTDIHKTVNRVNAYVAGNVHTSGLENFWSLMKRNLAGTYVAVEPFHLDACLDEQMFRFNSRATKDNPLDDCRAKAISPSLPSVAKKRPYMRGSLQFACGW
jgi:hypothetical protein